MMRIEGLENVLQRINQLNERFGVQPQPYNQNTGSFAHALAAAEKASPNGGTQAVQGSYQSAVTGTTAASTSLGSDTDALIADAARRYNVDPRLAAAVAQTESGGNQSAVSSAGAIGVMQLMPGTAASLGVNPYDKQQNIDGGVRLLKDMLNTFDNDIPKALAAYNAGAQTVKNYGGVPPYKETQNYINKVLDIYR